MKIVVTGNMGCGKSTVVAEMLKRLPEYSLFDFDQCVRDLYENEIVQMLLEHEFGTHDRKQISNIVHADSQKMKALGAIMNFRIVDFLRLAFKRENVILDIPLYFEHVESLLPSFNLRVDQIVCVTCDPELQRARILARDGISEEKMQSILDKQIDQEAKAFRSDIVIDNSGTLEQLITQIDNHFPQEQ